MKEREAIAKAAKDRGGHTERAYSNFRISLQALHDAQSEHRGPDSRALLENMFRHLHHVEDDFTALLRIIPGER